ncbi:transmembrane protein [Klebsiella grimontii]|uniref:Transmembrane protein n=1 Tax=Klebsiella grimontii TaxID=2058152 RepID=A0A7H4P961_9ENTR|nr:transmembrane protein [Klebsiella grimontii]
MKWMKAVLCGVLLGAAGTAASSDEAREQPLDYRQGLMLETSGASPWYRVELPPTIYQGTAWPDLRDVRVFNHQGETVPFALQAQKVQPAMPETMALRLFPLQMSLVPPREESRRGLESLLLRSTTGIEIRLETEDVKALGQSYLLTLPVDKTDAFALAQLRLNWESLAANWQGKASLYSSRDLKYWHPVQEDAPLMDLARDNDRLKMDTISASLTLSAQGNRYLLLILDAQSKAPALNSVTALAERREPESTRIELNAQAHRVSDEEAVWRWARASAADFAQNIVGRRRGSTGRARLAQRRNEPWQPLTKTVLYQLDGKRSDDIPLSGQPVEAVRIKTINARLSASLPAISGARR